MEVIGVSAPGPFVGQLQTWGIAPCPAAARDAARYRSATTCWPSPSSSGSSAGCAPTSSTPTIPSPASTAAWPPGRHGVPGIVNTVHGLYAAPEDPFARKAVVYSLERMAATCSQVELFQNPEDLEVMRRLRVPADRLVLLGNGVDLRTVPTPPRPGRRGPGPRRPSGSTPSAMVVGTVGRLVWGKGFRELFAAARLMRTIRPEVVFVIVGPEDDAKGDALGPDDIAEAESLGNVVFTGSPQRRRGPVRGVRPLRPPVLSRGVPTLGHGGGRHPGCRSSRPTSAVVDRWSTTV